MIQYQKLPKAYYEYNPKGKSYFRVSECEDCGMLYIEEVGVAVQGPDFYVDDELYICRDGTRFCVIGNSRGCCRTLKGAVRKLNKMLKERANNEV